MVTAHDKLPGRAINRAEDESWARGRAWFGRILQPAPINSRPDDWGASASDAEEPPRFERLLCALRLPFVAIALLPPLAFGLRVAP